MVVEEATAVAERHERQLNDTIELLSERIAELEFAQEDMGWTRLGGESTYEFSFDFLKRIVARSRLFYLNHPLIHRAVSLQADYVFAQGVNIQATDDEVNKVIQDFLDDEKNEKEITGHKARLLKEQTLMLDGNVFLVLFTDVSDSGKVQIRSILVDEIVDIITNPDDFNDVWYYKRQWTARDPETFETKQRIAYYPDIDYDPGIRGRRTSLKDGPIHWDAPIYHVNVGALAKSRYGVPEVYSALDWAQAFRNFLEDWATIVRSYARFAWKLVTPGGKNAVSAAKTRLGTTVGRSLSIEETNPPALAGSTFVTTKDGVNVEPIKTSGATTNARDGREIRMMVAAALGIPDTFFGDVDVGNLATARTLDRPTELKFRSRQQLWTDVHHKILGHVVKWAAVAKNGPLRSQAKFKLVNGRLVIEHTLDTHVEVVFPPILEHSILDRISAVANAVTLNGKTFAIDSPELAKTTMRLMFQALGLKDVDEITDRIFADIKDDTINGPEPEPTTGDDDRTETEDIRL